MKDLENALMYLISRRRDLAFKRGDLGREIDRLTDYINAIEEVIKRSKEKGKND